VRCLSCRASKDGGDWDHSGKSAVEAWNTRATQPQAPQGAVTGRLDEEDVDGHLKVALWEFLEKDAYQVVIPHGGILRGSRTGWITHIHVGKTFREAVQASISAAPETPEGDKK